MTTTKPLVRRFRSATSGLWYENPDAAGSIDAVELGGQIIERHEEETALSFIHRTADWASAIHAANRWIKTTDRLPDYETWVLLFLVTNNPENSGVVMGQRSSAHEGQFWDGDMYRPMAWISHWMPLPEPPPKPWTRP